ncbi:DUF4405 domain-containing protein [Sphingobium sp. TB-6]|uniref:DUF4405 domain-containing protein n=1 Tax=Sphingobium sp. TB-6 TaxID=2728850 RepID=UPI00146D9C92|nr:DUF4405 domain-containing protein [Sphingobium sp. TB-6]NML91265.1 DUF4405 domain-containing protein [Sphingobium sp. TB-6]
MSRRPPQFSTRLPSWQKWLIYTSFSLLVSAGVCWLVLEYFVRVDGEFGPERSPWQPTLLSIHGLACFAFLVAVGAMLPVHVRLGLLGKRNRKSGIATGGIILFMALTGYGLYYIADDSLRAWASTVHWLGGFTTVLIVSGHVWLAWKRPQAKRKAVPIQLKKNLPIGEMPVPEPQLEAAE